MPNTLKKNSKKAPAKTRRVKQNSYKSFKLSKPIKQNKPKLTGGFRLFYRAIITILKQKKVFAGVLFIALILNILLVRGLVSNTDLLDYKTLLETIFEGNLSQLSTSATIFGILLQGTGTTVSATGAIYQTFLMVILSLAYIWLIRATLSNKNIKLKIKDAFYKGMHPLITFSGVLFVIGLQLVPVAVSSFLYSVVISGGLAVTSLEIVLWLILIFLLILLSIYMVSSSIFALYIVTLPEVTPMSALKSARELVRYRRWSIIRKVLVLPLCLLVIGGLIIMPLIMVSPVLAEWVFYILSVMSLLIFHSYFYNLYRELL